VGAEGISRGVWLVKYSEGRDGHLEPVWALTRSLGALAMSTGCKKRADEGRG
jgi:hypothetical protein